MVQVKVTLDTFDKEIFLYHYYLGKVKKVLGYAFDLLPFLGTRYLFMDLVSINLLKCHLSAVALPINLLERANHCNISAGF